MTKTYYLSSERTSAKQQHEKNGCSCCRQYKWLLPFLTVKMLKECFWTGCFQQRVSEQHFTFSLFNINQKLKGGNEKKNPHNKETFCPQQHLFTQGEF